MWEGNTVTTIILASMLTTVSQKQAYANDITTSPNGFDTITDIPSRNIWPVYTAILNTSYTWNDSLASNQSEAFQHLSESIQREAGADKTNMLILTYQQSLRIHFTAEGPENVTPNMISLYDNRTRVFTTIFAGPPQPGADNESYSQPLRLSTWEVFGNPTENVTTVYIEEVVKCFYAVVACNIQITNITRDLVMVNFAMSGGDIKKQMQNGRMLLAPDAIWRRLQFNETSEREYDDTFLPVYNFTKCTTSGTDTTTTRPQRSSVTTTFAEFHPTEVPTEEGATIIATTVAGSSSENGTGLASPTTTESTTGAVKGSTTVTTATTETKGSTAPTIQTKPVNTEYSTTDITAMEIVCHGSEVASESGVLVKFPTEKIENRNIGSLQLVFSTTKCPNGRPVASILCQVIEGYVAEYINESLFVVECDVGLSNITAGNGEFEKEEDLENALKTLQIVIMANSLQETAFEETATFLTASIVSAVQAELTITRKTFEAGILCIDSITSVIASGDVSVNDSATLATFASVVEQYCKYTEIETNEAELQVKSMVIKLRDVERTEAVSLNITRDNTLQVETHIPTTALPRSANSSKTRVSVVLHADATLFASADGRTPSTIISINIGNEEVTNLPERVSITFSALNVKEGKEDIEGTLMVNKTTAQCVYYDETQKWSGAGLYHNATHPITCLTNHLTNFAVLVSATPVARDVTLDIVSKLGCCISIAGFLLTIILYLISKKWKKNRPALEMLHVSFNLLIAYVIFLAGVTPTNNRAACGAAAAFLQYFFLAAWLWLGVYTRDMYTSLVQVYSEQLPRYMMIVTAICYGTPLLIVILHVGIAVGHFDQEYRSTGDPTLSTYYGENYCWLHGYSLFFGFLFPVAVILLHNIISCGRVVYEITCKAERIDSSAKKQSTATKLRLAIVIGTLVGLTWVFAFLLILSSDPVYMTVMQWIFSLLNATQGLSMFIILCVRSKDIRSIWWPTLRRKVWLPIQRVFCKRRYARGLGRESKSGQEYDTTTRRTRLTDRSSYTVAQPSSIESDSPSGSEKCRRKIEGARLSISNSSTSSEKTLRKEVPVSAEAYVPETTKPSKVKLGNGRKKDKCVIIITSPTGDKVSEETIKI